MRQKIAENEIFSLVIVRDGGENYLNRNRIVES